ncbi:MAG TPA: ABATE domain-containing protein [Stellaceae bacterium]|nr:ABATE domain-containing protein [Stellaceae bacterium]
MADKRPPALFIADALGLDFLNSTATPVDEKVEWLDDGEGLLNWLEQAGLVPKDVAAAFRASALPGELDAVAAQARALREWFRGFMTKHMGKPLTKIAAAELAPLNRVLARDEAFGQVVLAPRESNHGGAAGLTMQARRRWRSPDSLLLPIAQTIAEFLSSEDLTYVRACEGPTCTLLFLDRTRGHARRWCSMAVCGNRAKQAAHRARSRRSRSAAR